MSSGDAIHSNDCTGTGTSGGSTGHTNGFSPHGTLPLVNESKGKPSILCETDVLN
jgi:hypothetical protein